MILFFVFFFFGYMPRVIKFFFFSFYFQTSSSLLRSLCLQEIHNSYLNYQHMTVIGHIYYVCKQYYDITCQVLKLFYDIRYDSNNILLFYHLIVQCFWQFYDRTSNAWKLHKRKTKRIKQIWLLFIHKFPKDTDFLQISIHMTYK